MPPVCRRFDASWAVRLDSGLSHRAPAHGPMSNRALHLLFLILAGAPASAAASEADPFASVAPPVSVESLAAPAELPTAGDGLRAPDLPVLDIGELQPRVLTLDLTRDANDIWDRIRRGFGMPDLDSQLVADQQAFYLNRPGFLRKVFERGGRYLYYIVDELERRGMPTELALLPMVESSYNPMAYSRAHASGLWQFIPSTGRNYNLTQDKWIDERRDVVASTNAALDYLQNIYEMHGDWQLALASYNWGEGAVGRAIQRNLAAGLPADYSSLRMPEETRNYIPKLQALKNIVAQPELFGFELPYVANERHFVTVEAPVGIDLAAAARLADMPLEDFVALNPAYNRPAVTGEGASLLVPADRAETFRLRLAEQARNGTGWRVHHLKRGETLASVARRAGLSLSEFRQINGLHARSRVAPGYALLVPDGADPSGALAVARLVPRAQAAAGSSGKKATGKKVAGKKKKKAGVKKAKTKKSAKKKGSGKKAAKVAADTSRKTAGKAK